MPTNSRQAPVDAYDEKDNPFRPEGELAKEAEEFVQKLKEKQEHDINQILNATVSSTTPLPSPNATLKLQQDAAEYSSPTKAEPAASVIDNATHQPVSPASALKHDASTPTSSSSKQPDFAASHQQTQSTPVNNESTAKSQQSPSSKEKKEKEAANGAQKKKTKPKCGCLIS